MKNIVKGSILSAALLFSLTACAPSVDTMVSNLKNNEFKVVETTDQSELLGLTATINLALTLVGEDFTVKIVYMASAGKVDDEGAHSASIVEFEDGSQAQNVYNVLGDDALQGEDEEEYDVVVVGAAIVSYNDDYTKGILGL